MKFAPTFRPGRLLAALNVLLDEIQDEDAAAWSAAPTDQSKAEAALRRAIEDANFKIFTGEYSYP